MLNCPVCSADIGSLPEEHANRHINRCLDGVAPEPTTAARDFSPSNNNNAGSTPPPHSPPPALEDSREENLALLTAVAPHLGRDAIVQLLDSCDGNVDMAASLIFEAGAMRAQPASPKNRQAASAADAGKTRASNVEEVVPVEVVVYDLQPDSVGKKFGMGAYHSGVHIFGREFSFGGSFNMAEDAGMPGVFSVKPYTCMPNLKKSVLIGNVKLSKETLQKWVEEWGSIDWRVDDYHMLDKNCNHFSDMLLRKLGEHAVSVAPPPPDKASDSTEEDSHLLDSELAEQIKAAFKLPAWVNRAANIGSKVVPEFIYKRMLKKMAPPGSTFEAPEKTAEPEQQPTEPQFSPQDEEHIGQIQSVMGVDRNTAAEAYLASDRNLSRAIDQLCQ